MNDLDVRSGPNLACAHAGPFADLGRDRFSHPALPRLARGKLFLKEPLGMTGAQVSLNVLPPGREMPSCHRHRENEELDLFVGGRGQVWVDGAVIEVSQGTAIRMSPAAVRTWRNDSDQPLSSVVIQYRADGRVGGLTSDGQAVPHCPHWPDHRWNSTGETTHKDPEDAQA